MSDGIRFTKGHGTENDFVLIPDANGRLELTPEQVRFLCDRRAGVGGDLLHLLMIHRHGFPFAV